MRRPRRCSVWARACNPRSRPTTRWASCSSPTTTWSLTMDFYQVEVRNRIAATSTFYGTIDGQLYSQVIVDAIIANGNVLDPEVTAEGDTGINLFTNGVTTRTRGVDLTVQLRHGPGRCQCRLERGRDLHRHRGPGRARHADRVRHHAAAVRPGGARRSDRHGAEVPGEPRRALRLESRVAQRARAGVRQVIAVGKRRRRRHRVLRRGTGRRSGRQRAHVLSRPRCRSRRSPTSS